PPAGPEPSTQRPGRGRQRLPVAALACDLAFGGAGLGAAEERTERSRNSRRTYRRGLPDVDGGGADPLPRGAPARLRRADSGGGEGAQASRRSHQRRPDRRSQPRNAGAADPRALEAPVELMVAGLRRTTTKPRLRSRSSAAASGRPSGPGRIPMNIPIVGLAASISRSSSSIASGS